jgi:hypothetical protein
MDRIRRAGLRPDLTTFNTAVKACSLAGAMDEAEQLGSSMKVLSSTYTHICVDPGMILKDI